MRDIDSWNDSQKKEWLEKHFLYEFRMLQYCYCMLVRLDCKNMRIKAKKEPICNMILEDFIVHARNLMEFLWKKNGGYPDSVRAPDFLKGNPWQLLKADDCPCQVKEILDEGSKYIQHLTSTRAKHTKDWLCKKILKDLAKRILTFLDVMPSQYYDPKFDDVKDSCKRILKSNEPPVAYVTAETQTFSHKWS